MNKNLRDETAKFRDESAKLRDESAKLRDEIENLRDETAKFRDESAKLRDEIENLREEFNQNREALEKRIVELEDKLSCSDKLNYVRATLPEQDADRQPFINALEALRTFLEDHDIGTLNDKLFPNSFSQYANMYNHLFETNIHANSKMQFTKELLNRLYKSVHMQ
jgi:chromosome segregation ATPase